MSRTFNDKPAIREKVPLLVGLYGPSGGGKTYSALRLSTGMQSVFGGDIGYVDTESKRALHYADTFKFLHVDFRAPYGSLDFLEAIRHFTAKGVRTVIVDSLSLEHEGEGGYLMTHAAEVERMSKGDLQKAERVKFAAWIKPARERRQLIDGILHENINLISCFRAKEKLKIRPGKEPEELGWMPIAGEEFLFEQTATCLLPPAVKGVPDWTAARPGEIKLIKLPQQFIGKLNDGKQLSEEHGRMLAEWAMGKPAPSAEKKADPPLPPQQSAPEPDWAKEIRAKGDEIAKKGTEALVAFWKSLTADQKQYFTATKDSEWKPTAAKANDNPF